MSMGTISIGWALVAVLFFGAGRLSGGGGRRLVIVALVESLTLTLLAALWFGTAGHGGWILVFGLLGLLVAGSQPLARLAVPKPGLVPDWRAFAIDFARYAVAGGLLAWRLG